MTMRQDQIIPQPPATLTTDIKELISKLKQYQSDCGECVLDSENLKFFYALSKASSVLEKLEKAIANIQ